MAFTMENVIIMYLSIALDIVLGESLFKDFCFFINLGQEFGIQNRLTGSKTRLDTSLPLR